VSEAPGRARPSVSIVLPVHNEADSLPVLWDELLGVLPRFGGRVEVIFVDDGSTDASADVLRGLVKRDPRVRLLRFERQIGLTAAFIAGLRAARGEILATMDSDLQNDPADLEVLLRHLDGADAAVGARLIRHDSWLKRVSSCVANAIRNRVTHEDVVDSACSLRVMRRACLEAWPPYEGMHRFVPTLLRLAGHRVVVVPVHHRPRRFGRSKFSVRNRAFAAFLDLLAVAWMGRRRLRYHVVEDVGGIGVEPREHARDLEPVVTAPRAASGWPGVAVSLLLPLLLAAALFLPAIGQRSIYHPDEARYAVLAKTMLQTGQWLVPQIADEVHLEKPPLFVWAIALVSLLTGSVNTFSATLPAALSAMAGVLGTALLGRQLFGTRTGLMAGVVLATTPGYFWHARLVLADIMVAAFIVWSAWAFWRALDDPARQRGWIALFYAFLGLAVSAKGPAGLMPLVTCGAFVLADQGVRGLRMLRPVMGVAILAVMWAPWGFAFAAQGGATFVQRVVIEDYALHLARWEHVSELFFALGPLGVAALPWSLFVPIAALSGLRSADEPTRRKFRFLGAWALAYVVVMTLMAHKRDRYLLPAYPALALMVGWLWSRWGATTLTAALRRHGGLVVAFAAIAATVILLPVRQRGEFAVWIPDTLGRALPVAAVLLVAGALGYLACRAVRPRAAFTVLATAMTLVLAYETRIFVRQYNMTYDVRGFTERLARRVNATDELLAFRHGRLVYDFYLGRPIPQIRDTRELQPLLDTPHPLYVLTDERGWRILTTGSADTWSVVDRTDIAGRAVVLLRHVPAPQAAK
jgi:4-amino-4-deoxy-L-arabinose transferase-like glycosyltransferase